MTVMPASAQCMFNWHSSHHIACVLPYWYSGCARQECLLVQGEVYELLNERSEPMSLVLKTIPHGAVSAVTGILPSMEREWAIGHRLALYCTTPTGGATLATCPYSLQKLMRLMSLNHASMSHWAHAVAMRIPNSASVSSYPSRLHRSPCIKGAFLAQSVGFPR